MALALLPIGELLHDALPCSRARCQRAKSAYWLQEAAQQAELADVPEVTDTAQTR